jgi:DNA-binding response OmpR family regulator
MGDVAPGTLVVDDDEDVRESLALAIEALGFGDVLRASSLAAVRAAQRQALGCRLAILDINLGPSSPSGVEVLQWLRAQGFAGEAVFLTGHAATDPRVMAASKLPATRVLTKPISLDALAALFHGGAAALQ